MSTKHDDRQFEAATPPALVVLAEAGGAGTAPDVSAAAAGNAAAAVPVPFLSPSMSKSSTTLPCDAAEPAADGEQAASSPVPLRKHISIQDQSTRLSFKRILLIYFGIGVALVVSFVDQTSVSTAAPVIGTELGGSDSISWVGTAFFVANCALHLVYGRLSDIFGRKNMLQIAMFLLCFGNLLCGFAKTPIQLYVFRAIAGMGGGGINGMAMVIVSDIVPLKDRGKYQGFISAACSLGSAIGPFVGGALSSVGAWRWTFWLTTILGTCCLVLDQFILPLKPVTGDLRKKLAQIDYLGIFLSAAATVLLLVPISGGGTTFAWSSATAIVLLVLGSLLGVGFIIGQWKFAKLPILPLHLFKDLTTSIVMFQSFLIGIVYYANIYYIPIYLQYVLSYDAFMSGVFILVFTFPQTLWAIGSGFYISKTNRYKIVILVGSGLWALGTGLQIIWTGSTHLGYILGILQLQSIGIGFSLQTTLIAALNTTAAPDRAVVTSARNFFRTMGGAFGLAIANAIYNNTASAQLSRLSFLDSTQQNALLRTALQALSAFSGEQRSAVQGAFAEGLKMVWIFFTAVAVCYFAISFGIKEVIFKADSPELEAERLRNRKKSARDPEKEATGEKEMGSVVRETSVDSETPERASAAGEFAGDHSRQHRLPPSEAAKSGDAKT